jgi:hypothetical protein
MESYVPLESAKMKRYNENNIKNSFEVMSATISSTLCYLKQLPGGHHP